MSSFEKFKAKSYGTKVFVRGVNKKILVWFFKACDINGIIAHIKSANSVLVVDTIDIFNRSVGIVLLFVFKFGFKNGVKRIILFLVE